MFHHVTQTNVPLLIRGGAALCSREVVKETWEDFKANILEICLHKLANVFYVHVNTRWNFFVYKKGGQKGVTYSNKVTELSTLQLPSAQQM